MAKHKKATSEPGRSIYLSAHRLKVIVVSLGFCRPKLGKGTWRELSSTDVSIDRACRSAMGARLRASRIGMREHSGFHFSHRHFQYRSQDASTFNGSHCLMDFQHPAHIFTIMARKCMFRLPQLQELRNSAPLRQAMIPVQLLDLGGVQPPSSRLQIHKMGVAHLGSIDELIGDASDEDEDEAEHVLEEVFC